MHSVWTVHTVDGMNVHVSDCTWCDVVELCTVTNHVTVPGGQIIYRGGQLSNAKNKNAQYNFLNLQAQDLCVQQCRGTILLNQGSTIAAMGRQTMGSWVMDFAFPKRTDRSRRADGLVGH